MYLTTWKQLDNSYEEGNLKKYITDGNKNGVLIWASENGHLEVVKYLVEKRGADVITNNDGAVQWASENGHLEVVKYLINHGADARSSNNYAVRNASVNGHLEVVKYLVEKCRADVRVNNDWAVRWASEDGHFEVVKYLINHGAVLSTPNPKYEKYILVCEKGEEKRRERASKKIYFWWVQVCYDIKRPCGNRMMRRNYEEYHKIVFLKYKFKHLFNNK